MTSATERFEVVKVAMVPALRVIIRAARAALRQFVVTVDHDMGLLRAAPYRQAGRHQVDIVSDVVAASPVVLGAAGEQGDADGAAVLLLGANPARPVVGLE